MCLLGLHKLQNLEGLTTIFLNYDLLARREVRYACLHPFGETLAGAYWHIIQTFVGSLIIIVAALTIRYTGFLAIDPLLGIAFGFVLLWASWGILRDSVHLLMEGTPPGVDLLRSRRHSLGSTGCATCTTCMPGR